MNWESPEQPIGLPARSVVGRTSCSPLPSVPPKIDDYSIVNSSISSVILIRIPICDVPAVGLIVEPARYLHGVHLDGHLDRRLHVEVPVALEEASERAVHHVTTHLVRVLDPCRAIHP